MSRSVAVADRAANKNELIAHAAEVIGRGQKRDVFEAIYYHKSRVKTVAEIAAKTGLTRMQVLKAAGKLADEEIVNQTKKDRDTAYEQIDLYQSNKQKVLSLSADKKKLAAYPTKRKVVGVLPVHVNVKLPTKGAKAKLVTIDDIDFFAKVKGVKTKTHLGATLSEDEFKEGVKAILGELGTFKDWGGESSDLYTSRVKMNAKRLTAGFAFKGPGKQGKLVPGKMGKNGDQIQRLFGEAADIYIVQYHGQIDPSVQRQMQAHAVAKAHYTGDTIYYGVIDGADSERLRLAYPMAFPAEPDA